MALENNQIDNSNLDNDEISLKELLIKVKDWYTFLLSKWKIILIAGIIGGLVGFIYAKLDKPNYKAILTFAMEEGGGGGGGGLSGALGLASGLGIDLGGGGIFATANITSLMKTRLIIEKTLLKPILVKDKTTTLAEYYLEVNRSKESWGGKPNLKNVNFLPNSDRSNYTLAQDSILEKIYQNLVGKETLLVEQKDKKVSILSIEVTSKDELFSKLFCENLAKETSNFYILTKSKKARINVDILQTQVDSIKRELKGSLSGVASEIDQVYNLNPSLNIKTVVSKNRQVDVQANTSILTNLVVQLELAKINLRKETPLIQELDKPILPLIKIQINKITSILIGGIIAGFLILLYLIISRMYKKAFK
jgi:hypothetical protein